MGANLATGARNRSKATQQGGRASARPFRCGACAVAGPPGGGGWPAARPARRVHCEAVSRSQRSMSLTRVLTGITTSGTPHLGNYVGAVRPAVAASRTPNVESFYFLADYHALIKLQD